MAEMKFPLPVEFEWFKGAGHLLYGDQWAGQMAHAVGVDRRTIYKWRAAGTVPGPISIRVCGLLIERRAALRAFATRRRPIHG